MHACGRDATSAADASAMEGSRKEQEAAEAAICLLAEQTEAGRAAACSRTHRSGAAVSIEACQISRQSTKQADRGKQGAPPRAAGHGAAVQQHVLQRNGLSACLLSRQSTNQADRGAPTRAAGHGAAVQQHVLQRDGQRGVVPVHDHAHAVPDQQDVNARCIHLPGAPHQRPAGSRRCAQVWAKRLAMQLYLQHFRRSLNTLFGRHASVKWAALP